MVDVVFSVFDERTGPIAIYSTIKDTNFTKKIAVKSIVSTLTSVRGSGSERLEGEAIIPFPDEKQIAFIFYSSLDQKTEGGEFRVFSLSTLVDESNKTGLYSNAASLSHFAGEIKFLLNNQYKYGKSPPNSIIEKLEAWGQIASPKQLEIIAEEEIKFNLHMLFDLFSSKKGILGGSDSLTPLFLGLLTKTSVVISGPDIEFLLQVSDLLREYLPSEDLDVRLSIALRESYVPHSISFGIPRSDIVLMNDEQLKKAFFYREPVIRLGIGKEPRYDNYNPPSKAIKAVSKIIDKARSYKDETVKSHYFKGELIAFFTKLSTLKDFCLSGRKGTIKKFAKDFGVSEEYIYLLAETLRMRRQVSASVLNEMFLGETFFTKVDSLLPESIGIIQ